MVMQLKRLSRDPNASAIKKSGREPRGPGLYYYRSQKRLIKGVGNGKDVWVTDGYYSRYSEKRDKNTLSEKWKVDKIGIPKDVARKYAHITDGDITRYFKKKW